MTQKCVRPGADFVLDRPGVVSENARVGLICNPTSVQSDFTHLADAIIDDGRYTPVALFGPEHGFFSTAQDMIGVDQQTYRGVPVHSLYDGQADSLAPDESILANCDVLIFDLQDVGSRYYTYVWTMTAAMEVCAKIGIRFVVCDRPNPIGATRVEGPLLQPGFESFVGAHAVCTRHAMTAGEIALMVNAENNLGCDLVVVQYEGGDRSMLFDRTDLSWIMPSPNMPTLDTAIVYPGGCLIEGTNLSEGRGTTRPFELVGAPFLDSHKLARALNDKNLPGVYFRPVQFEPTFQKFAKQTCGGVFVHVTDRNVFRPVAAYLELIIAARILAPGAFEWRSEEYEFVTDIPAIDLLFGTDQVRKSIEAGQSREQITADWKPGIKEFEARRGKYLTYGRSLER